MILLLVALRDKQLERVFPDHLGEYETSNVLGLSHKTSLEYPPRIIVWECILSAIDGIGAPELRVVIRGLRLTRTRWGFPTLPR